MSELPTTNTRVPPGRDRYRELFELAPDGYFVTDRFGVVREVNAAAARALGVEPHSLQGRSLTAFVDDADAGALRDAIGALETSASFEIEVRLLPRNDEPTWHGIKAALVESGAAILWSARNVHARRETPASTLQSAADLERANRDKAELLVRERRLRARLEEAHVAKDRLVASLAHDLRAPLNAVLGWTQLLRRERLDVHARDRGLATIEHNATMQLRLLDEALDITHLTGEGAPLERTRVDLRELVERSVQLVGEGAAAGGVAIRVTRGEEPLVVSGERRRLQKAVANLLSNAVKFTPPGGSVEVSLSSTNGRARIAVQDTGRGIAPALLPHVFEAFRRRPAEDAAPPDGLGLYIVRQAVEMHGGEVIAASEGVGQGARFTIMLPISTPSGSSPPKAAVAGSGPARPAADALRGIRVLVVDDEEDARELTGAVLRQRGAVVSLAADVATALATFDASPVDVVVSDIAMPEADGYALASALRQRPGVAVALVAMSGFSAPDEVQRALAAGFDLHLAKPIDATELIAVILDAVRARSR